MKISVALEWMAITIPLPLLIGMGDVFRGAPAFAANVEMADLERMANILSLWAALAVACWCGTRLLANAFQGRSPNSRKADHDRLVSRVLAVLIGFAGLLVCEPLADGVERLFLWNARHLALTPSTKAILGWVGFAIQFVVVSVALGALVRGWLAFSSSVLKLGR